MADNKVRKGFLFYLLMLILLLVAVFFVLVVIMVFSPGLDIMGYKYFSNVSEKLITQISNTDGTLTRVDLSQPVDILINGNLTNVEIVRDSVVKEFTIKIENYQTGFAYADQNTDVSYSIKYEKPITASYYQLKIDIVNAEGFMYFNNNCYVQLLIPEDETVNAESLIDISLQSGNIALGTKSSLDESKSSVDINHVVLSTNEGNITLGKYFEPTITTLNINQSRGEFNALNSLTIKSGNSVNIIGNKTNFKFNDIVLENYDTESAILNLDINNGSFSSTKIYANTHLDAVSSKIDISNFKGKFDSNDLVNKMDKMDLNIGTIEGSISLPFANNCNINIDDAKQAKVFISSDSADINIKNLGNDSWIESSEGSINVSLLSQENTITIIGENTAIDVNCTQEMLTSLVVKNDVGKTNLNYYSTSKFTVYFYDLEGNLKKSNVKVEGYEDMLTNPLYVNGGNFESKIYSNSEITMNVIKEA